MARKKKPTTGAEHVRKKGLRSLLVAVRPDVRAALKTLASYENRSAQDVTAAGLEEWLRGRFASRGLPWPEEQSEES